MPGSPNLLKCEDPEDIIEDIIEELIESACYERSTLRLAEVNRKEKLYHRFINVLYSFFKQYSLINLNITYPITDLVITKKDDSIIKSDTNYLNVYDNHIELGSNLKIPYEFISRLSKQNNFIYLNLVEFKYTNIQFSTTYVKNIFNQIYKNMNYHVRYNPIHTSAINFYSKTKIKTC